MVTGRLFQLVYISTARAELIGDGCSDILAASRRNNEANGVTGLLLFDGRRFLQVLEGARPPVEALFGRIARDPRHRGVVRLSTRDISAREYGGWAMRFVNRTHDLALLGEVGRLNDAARTAIRAGVEGYGEFMLP